MLDIWNWNHTCASDQDLPTKNPRHLDVFKRNQRRSDAADAPHTPTRDREFTPPRDITYRAFRLLRAAPALRTAAHRAPTSTTTTRVRDRVRQHPSANEPFRQRSTAARLRVSAPSETRTTLHGPSESLTPRVRTAYVLRRYDAARDSRRQRIFYVDTAMMMKTRTQTSKNGCSLARIALGAAAVLALAGQAHAAITFASVTTAGTGACAAILFLDADGSIQPTGTSLATQGRLQAITPGTEADFGDCETIAGWYVHTMATSDGDGTSLVLKKAPTTHFSLGGALPYSATTTAVGAPSAGTSYNDAKLYACPTNSAAAGTGATTLASCIVDAGYYIARPSDSATSATNLVLAAVPTGYYALGGTISASSQVRAHWWYTPGVFDDPSTAAAAGVIACPTNSATAATDATTLASCLVDAGYYISTKAQSTTVATGVVLTAVPTGYYALGGTISASSQTHVWDGTTASTAAAAGVIACPFGGTTTSTGKSLLTECSPDCATTSSNAEVAAGTCRCKANYYGTPKDSTGATVSAVTTVCTACDAGATAPAGSTAASACTGGTAPTGAYNDPSGAAGMSVLAAISAVAAAQFVL